MSGLELLDQNWKIQPFLRYRAGVYNNSCNRTCTVTIQRKNMRGPDLINEFNTFSGPRTIHSATVFNEAADKPWETRIKLAQLLNRKKWHFENRPKIDQFKITSAKPTESHFPYHQKKDINSKQICEFKINQRSHNYLLYTNLIGELQVLPFLIGR